MRKMLCEIDLEKAQGYPGRYLEHFSTMNRAPAYAECRELVVKLGLSYSGRAGRLEFMVITAMNWVISALISATLEYTGWTDEQNIVQILVPFVVLGLLEAPVLVRRLRDMGRPLKSALLVLLPMVNIVFLFLLATRAGSTEVESAKKPDYESTTASDPPLKCPDCASTNCVRDNALQRVGNVLGKVMRRLPPVWYRCFDCGHEWKE